MAEAQSATYKSLYNSCKASVDALYKRVAAGDYSIDFPGINSSEAIPEAQFKAKAKEDTELLIKQVEHALTAEELSELRKQVDEYIDSIAKSYTEFRSNNGFKYGVQNGTGYDADPEVSQVGYTNVRGEIYPVYGTFIAGKQQQGVSGYAGINNTYSMCDIVCTIDIAANGASNLSEHVVATLGKLQTISYSIYQQKQPVRVLGNMNAKDYVYGQRTIAGSLVFAVFNRHWLVDIYDQLVNKGIMKNWHYVADELPPFNITISFANEYGFDSKMALFGVRLMTEGQVMSINDIYIENTYQFVAMDIEYMDALNAWQTTDKIDRRWTNTKTSGIITSNADSKIAAARQKAAEQAANEKNKMNGKTIPNKNDNPIGNQEAEVEEEVSGNSLLQGQTLAIHTADSIKNTSKEDKLAELYEAYQTEVSEIESSDMDEEEQDARIKELANQYIWEYEQIEKQYSGKNDKSKKEIADDGLRILKGDQIYDPDDPGNIPVTPVQEQAVNNIADFKQYYEDECIGEENEEARIEQFKENNVQNIIHDSVNDAKATLNEIKSFINEMGEDGSNINLTPATREKINGFNEILNSPAYSPETSNEDAQLEKLYAYIENIKFENPEGFTPTKEQQVADEKIDDMITSYAARQNAAFEAILEENENAEKQKEQARKESEERVMNRLSEIVNSSKNLINENIPLSAQKWYDTASETVTQYQAADSTEKSYEQAREKFNTDLLNNINRYFSAQQIGDTPILNYTSDILKETDEEILKEKLKNQKQTYLNECATAIEQYLKIDNKAVSDAAVQAVKDDMESIENQYNIEFNAITKYYKNRARPEQQLSNTISNIQKTIEEKDNDLVRQILQKYPDPASQNEAVAELIKSESNQNELTSALNSIQEYYNAEARRKIESKETKDANDYEMYDPSIKYVNAFRSLQTGYNYTKADGTIVENGSYPLDGYLLGLGGTNCVRATSIAFAGTPYAGWQTTDELQEVAKELGQFHKAAYDPNTYEVYCEDGYQPKTGDIAITANGLYVDGHAVVMTETGGTIHCGDSKLRCVNETETEPGYRNLEHVGKIMEYDGLLCTTPVYCWISSSELADMSPEELAILTQKVKS